MFYVYILVSLRNNSYYIGSCKDVEKRVSLHNLGFVKSTKRYLPWRLAYKKSFDNLKLARARELEIKSWKKRASIEGLLEHSKIG